MGNRFCPVGKDDRLYPFCICRSSHEPWSSAPSKILFTKEKAMPKLMYSYASYCPHQDIFAWSVSGEALKRTHTKLGTATGV